MTDNNRILVEQANNLYRQSPLLLTAVTVVMLAVIIAYFDRTAPEVLFSWAGAVVIITVARVFLVRKYLMAKEITKPKIWLNWFAFSSFVSGISWGVFLPSVIPPEFSSDILVLSLILLGMASGSLVPLSGYFPAYIAFIIPTGVPSGIYFLTEQSGEYILSGVLVFVYVFSMIGLSYMTNRTVIDAIKLRLANQKLLENLREKKDLAEQANKNKSHFLSAISHDLRQPLYAVDLYLGALELKIKDHSHRDLLLKAMASNQSLSNMFNSLMEVSTFDLGRVQVNYKVFSLTSILELISSECKMSAAEKGINIEENFDEIVINSDPDLVARMVRNLIANAISHNDNCTLKLSTELSSNTLMIHVEDNGIGIDSLELKNIFNEYYQLNNPERDRSKGLGLGLDIVKRLAQLLQIRIEVESKLNLGSRFSLILNREQLQPSPLIQNKIQAEIDLSGKFIIVIDDDEMILDATKTLLRSWNAEVLLADSAQILLEELSKDDYAVPDLIISDYRLREAKTGLEAITVVRDYFQHKIAAIVITGDSSMEIKAKIKQFDCQLLLKPVQPEKLYAQIETALNVD